MHPNAEPAIELPDLFRPAPATVLLVAPTALLAAALAGRVAAWLRTARGVRVPITRKAFHFLIFTAAALVQLWRGAAGVFVFGATVALFILHAVWRGGGHAVYDALARPGDAPHGRLFIVAPLVTTALGGVLANLMFRDLALVGYLVTGWGDAAGEPVGVRWGRHRYRAPSLAGVAVTRSLEGSAAVFGVAAAAGFAGLLMLGTGVAAALPAALAAATAGTAVEAISPHGLDNLTVQLVAAGVAFLVL